MVENNEKCGNCRAGYSPTPKDHLQFLKDLLWACGENVDSWYEQFGGNNDPEKALLDLKNHLVKLVKEAAVFKPKVGTNEGVKNVAPAVCYTAYYACIPGPTCAGQLQQCLISKSGKEAAD